MYIIFSLIINPFWTQLSGWPNIHLFKTKYNTIWSLRGCKLLNQLKQHSCFTITTVSFKITDLFCNLFIDRWLNFDTILDFDNEIEVGWVLMNNDLDFNKIGSWPSASHKKVLLIFDNIFCYFGVILLHLVCMKNGKNKIFMNKNVSTNKLSIILPEYIKTLTCVDNLNSICNLS